MFYLGCSTLHYLGKHWVDIYRAGTPRRLWFMSFEYGKDYMSAVRFVQQLNREGR